MEAKNTPIARRQFKANRCILAILSGGRFRYKELDGLLGPTLLRRWEAYDDSLQEKQGSPYNNSKASSGETTVKLYLDRIPQVTRSSRSGPSVVTRVAPVSTANLTR